VPKRLLDDSLLTSVSLARCSARAQDAFPRFILLADDFGCFEAFPRVLLARGWPYRQDVTESDLWAWLEEYVTAGMACLWAEKERRWCYLTGWDGEHGQRKRAEYDPAAPKGTPGAHGSKRRTPPPPQELVAAVKAGARRDHDGKPPGVDRECGGAAEIPPGNPDPVILNNSAPARETAGSRGGAAEFPGGSAAPVAVPAADPVPAAAAAGEPAPQPAERPKDPAEASFRALVVEDEAGGPEAPSWVLLEQFKPRFADRINVPRDWLRIATPELVVGTRDLVEAELRRLGVPRAIEAAAEACFRETKRGKRKPQYLRWYLGALQDADRLPEEAVAGAPGAPIEIPALPPHLLEEHPELAAKYASLGAQIDAQSPSRAEAARQRRAAVEMLEADCSAAAGGTP
jgi:hypothetical protein